MDEKVNGYIKETLGIFSGLARGLGTTLIHLFKKNVTEEYPEYKRPLFERTRARIILTRDPEGEERCVACYLCAAACPVSCISMGGAEREDGRRWATWFRINFARCIYCGLCEEACPTLAIQLTAHYEFCDDDILNLVVSTGLAVSQRKLVHAVVFLIISFFATALLFYLLGAPFLAALEVIIYAGAVMVMFLFIIMTLKLEKEEPESGTSLRPWFPAILLGGISLVLLVTLLWMGQDHGALLKLAMAAPREVGKYLFREFWFSVEVVSFLLFVALAGALYLAKEHKKPTKTADSQQEAS
ncbi:NADH-quinone oxidoreductase, chain I [delta proteobacterium NaphS2]|nr:NADH-quinone oxidoreductase, chain I [delta proteobacterium NaphS2]